MTLDELGKEDVNLRALPHIKVRCYALGAVVMVSWDAGRLRRYHENRKIPQTASQVVHRL